MKKLLVTAYILTASTVASFAQPAPQQQQQSYVPIVLDAAKFDAFYNALTEISMPAKSFQAVVSLLQSLERQAQQEKAQADSAAAVAAEAVKSAGTPKKD